MYHSLKKLFSLLAVGLISLSAMPVNAGGIALGSTRIIYPIEKKQVSLSLTNSDDKKRFLIQSWVENLDGTKNKDFILTPPLFVSKPLSENTLRIMYSGADIPADREQAYWLNSKAIPAVSSEAIEDKNVLQIAIQSRIKLFLRPETLPYPAIDAPGKLTFHNKNQSIVVNNPSPYYITLINVKAGEENLNSLMIPPMVETLLPLKNHTVSALSFQTINDYGANTDVINVQVK
ncbi:molecular chaperone [Enterobacterales bacterium CwR94]|nr:molecular chaperone [Enterobacterales bacterium CwR94]